jgi:hypothetical protein
LKQSDYDNLTINNKNLYYNEIVKKIEIETDKSIRKVYAQNLYDLGYRGSKKYLKIFEIIFND